MIDHRFLGWLSLNIDFLFSKHSSHIGSSHSHLACERMMPNYSSKSAWQDAFHPGVWTCSFPNTLHTGDVPSHCGRAQQWALPNYSSTWACREVFAQYVLAVFKTLFIRRWVGLVVSDLIEIKCCQIIHRMSGWFSPRRDLIFSKDPSYRGRVSSYRLRLLYNDAAREDRIHVVFTIQAS